MLLFVVVLKSLISNSVGLVKDEIITKRARVISSTKMLSVFADELFCFLSVYIINNEQNNSIALSLDFNQFRVLTFVTALQNMCNINKVVIFIP